MVYKDASGIGCVDLERRTESSSPARRVSSRLTSSRDAVSSAANLPRT